MRDCGCGEQVAAAVESLRMEMLRLRQAQVAPRELYERTMAMQSVLTADGSGNATANVGPPVAGFVWRVERISMHSSAGSPALGVYVGPKGVTSPAYRRDWTAAVADSIADESQPIYVGENDFLVLDWTGATAAAILSAALQVRVYRLGLPRGSGPQ